MSKKFFILNFENYIHIDPKVTELSWKNLALEQRKGLLNKSDKNKFSGCLFSEKVIKPLYGLVKGFLSRGVSFLRWHSIDKVSQSFNIYEYLSHLLLLCFQVQHISI